MVIFLLKNLLVCFFFNYLVKLKQKNITMKKLFLVATLMVAGLMSANTIAPEVEITEENTPTVEAVEAESAFACVSATLSCGIEGVACGDTTGDIVEVVLIADAILCP